MRIGIVALLHESNTFSHQTTTVDSFRQNLLVTGESVRTAMEDSHHEVSGFFAGLKKDGAEAVPLFAARALPSGTIQADAFTELVRQLIDTVKAANHLDGILVAPHGATVSEQYPDADGYWLSELRRLIGPDMPIIGTLDAHANLSPLMVQSCDALIAYRTNPHLDQRQRGIDAAAMMVQTVAGKIRPRMVAAYPPMAISIERQCTDEPHLSPLYKKADLQLSAKKVLSNSILLGFPYSDVAEMGSSTIVITDNDARLAKELATELASEMWATRFQLQGSFTSVAQALNQIAESNNRTCLLDMGDNVGGGSSADGTELLNEIHQRKIPNAFGCLFDPNAVEKCVDAGAGGQLTLTVGGHTDTIHGAPIKCAVTVLSLHDGIFHEAEPRHGGITDFDQGRTVICRTDGGLTLMLTSRRMVPFSLQQLISCNLNPADFRILVAKGVNAPIAAYRDVCDRFIRVNTKGSTCADMHQLTYHHRRKPLFPLEQHATFSDKSTL